MPNRNHQLWANSWVIRGLSLLFTLFLFVSVKAENASNSRNSNLSTSIETTITLDKVTVELGKANQDSYITGLPETVAVTLKGPRNILTQITETNLVVQTQDLTELETGQHTVKLVIADLPRSVSYSIDPDHVTIQLDHKKSQTFAIEYDLSDNLVADGYQVTDVALDPKEIELSGPQSTIEQIHRVFINIYADQAQTQNYKNVFPLQIVDAQGQLLDISADVSTVTAKVKIETSTKSVDLNIVPEGEYQDIFTYHYTFAGDTKVKISGNAKVLETIESLPVKVNVANLTQSGKLTGIIQVPDQVSVNTGNEIEVIVTVSPLAINSETSQASTEQTTQTTITSETSTSNEDKE